MKRLKVMTAIVAVTLAGFASAMAFADDATNTPPPRHHGQNGHGPMLDHLLPVRIVDGLTLTVEQNTTYTSLETAFKKDAAKWNAENPIDPEAVKKARETGDKEALRQFGEKRQGLMDIRKGYLDKLRGTLTDEQKTKLDKALEDMRSRREKRAPDQKSANPPTPAE